MACSSGQGQLQETKRALLHGQAQPYGRRCLRSTLPTWMHCTSCTWSDTVTGTPSVHYNSEPNVINLPASVGCLNWKALRTRPDIVRATSRATSMITHDPDTSFIRVKHLCQYLHHTLGCALSYVPLPLRTCRRSP